jgi:predicted dithiol-disulfide oxidoreductase (DUF899 family)
MPKHPIVSEEEWIAARKKLLAEEKELTRRRDKLSEKRRKLPWTEVTKAYVFDGPDGKETLADLFAGRRQLAVYHFMFHPDWQEGCKSCSFWADGFDGIAPHLNQRDVTLVAVSRAPRQRFEPFRKRMGWKFKWLSSHGGDFNADYGVHFTPTELKRGKVNYNYQMRGFPVEDAPGLSVFYRDDGGQVFHTYSCYARGLDMLNGAYNYLDLMPNGRDEAGEPYTMAWVRHHDRYGT